jgi:hypothetical protein
MWVVRYFIQFYKKVNKMAQQLEITAILKKAIQISEIEQERLNYFIDKRKAGRRYKFFGVHPTEKQVNYLNKLLQIAKVDAVASILPAKPSYRGWVSPYSNNCLVILAK